jgi:hypothetical protein
VPRRVIWSLGVRLGTWCVLCTEVAFGDGGRLAYDRLSCTRYAGIRGCGVLPLVPVG